MSTLHTRVMRRGLIGVRTEYGWWGPSFDVTVTRTPTRSKVVVLREPLYWTDPDGMVIKIPEGFVSDGATLPPLTWWLLGGKLSLEWISAAIVHDYSCTYHATLAKAWSQPPEIVTQRFYRGLRADTMGWSRANAAALAVRLFGPPLS